MRGLLAPLPFVLATLTLAGCGAATIKVGDDTSDPSGTDDTAGVEDTEDTEPEEPPVSAWMGEYSGDVEVVIAEGDGWPYCDGEITWTVDENGAATAEAECAPQWGQTVLLTFEATVSDEGAIEGIVLQHMDAPYPNAPEWDQEAEITGEATEDGITVTWDSVYDFGRQSWDITGTAEVSL